MQKNTTAYAFPQIAGDLPSSPVPQQLLQDLPELPLADPKFYESTQIAILVGADVLKSILLSGPVWVDPKHTPFQLILFHNSEGHIRDFEL